MNCTIEELALHFKLRQGYEALNTAESFHGYCRTSNVLNYDTIYDTFTNQIESILPKVLPKNFTNFTQGKIDSKWTREAGERV